MYILQDYYAPAPSFGVVGPDDKPVYDLTC